MIKEGNVKMTAKEFYETIGQNYEEVLERLAGSEALVLRFLKKFSTDKTFSELEKAMEARDVDDGSSASPIPSRAWLPIWD